MTSTLESPPSSTFQFTHPGRGATLISSIFLMTARFQFTHPGRGATSKVVFALPSCAVSIHAPRKGCDELVPDMYKASEKFQFTHPGRGAT